MIIMEFIKDTLKAKFIRNRMNIFALATIVLLVMLYFGDGGSVASRLPQIGYMLVRITAAGFLGYHLSKFVFKDMRPKDMSDKDELIPYMFCRAFVIAGALVGAGMAV